MKQVTRLRYTPRKFVVHPESNMLIVAEADHAAVPLAERRATEDGMETDNALTDVRMLSVMGSQAIKELQVAFCPALVRGCAQWQEFHSRGQVLHLGLGIEYFPGS